MIDKLLWLISQIAALICIVGVAKGTEIVDILRCGFAATFLLLIGSQLED